MREGEFERMDTALLYSPYLSWNDLQQVFPPDQFHSLIGDRISQS